MRKRVSVFSVVILSLAIPVYLLNSDNQNEISVSSVVVEKAEMPVGDLIPVERVIDGDTIKIIYEGKSESVRIIGINTPETKHPEKPIECFGPEASNFAEELMSNKEILLEFDESQGKYDKYNRLLAYIWLPNGQLYSEVAIENGFGFEDTYDGEYKYQKVHQDAQSKAEKNESGLWLSCPEWPEYPELTVAPGENECDPNYSGTCVPITNSDLDCVDIGGPVNIIGTDIHRLDRDGDKKACLSS